MTTSGRRQQRSPGRRPKWPAELVERLGGRFENGETAAQIAQSLGSTKSAIASLLWRHGYLRAEHE